MKRMVIGWMAAAVLTAATPAVAAQEVPQATAPAYNCDFMPSCEVAPGMYGKMGSPVTSKFNLSIGGFVKLDYTYNSVNLGQSGSLAPGSGAIPKAGSAQAQRDQSIVTARQSRFWLKIAGPGLLGAKTGALIEADFYGDPSAANEAPQLRLRHAYGTIDWAKTSILFGQTWDIFGPMAANTLDFRQGSSFGAPNQPRVPQIRVSQKVDLTPDNSLRLVIGVQDPNQDANNSGTAAAVSDNVGAAVNVAGQAMWISKALGVSPGFWGLSMNSLTAGFFGLFGSQKVKDNANRAVDSYGYGFYTFIPILKSSDGKSRKMTASFEGQAFMAANMAFNLGTSMSVIGSLNNLKAAKGYGFAGQFIFYPTQDLGISTGYSRRNAYNYASYLNSTYTGTGANPTTRDFQKYNQQFFLNASYDLNAALRLAVEYENLNTHYGNLTGGTAGSGTVNIGRVSAMYFF